MITTAGSITGAVRVVREYGAKRIYVGATHGVFCGPAVERLNAAQVDGVVVSNTCSDSTNMQIRNLTRVSVAPLLGEAIRRVHRNESVSHLFD